MHGEGDLRDGCADDGQSNLQKRRVDDVVERVEEHHHNSWQREPRDQLADALGAHGVGLACDRHIGCGGGVSRIGVFLLLLLHGVPSV